MIASKTASSSFLQKWLRGSAIAVALAAACMMFGITALKADCGLPGNHLLGSVFKPSAFVTEAAEESGLHQASVVGLWHVKLVQSDGSLLFQSLVQYHPDGLEAESADQSAITPANYCMGVWKQHGNTVEIYHIAWLFNAGSPVGYAVITQRNTLSSDGNSYSGHFDFKQYLYDFDSSNNITDAYLAADFGGTTTGHRIDFQHPFALY